MLEHRPALASVASALRGSQQHLDRHLLEVAVLLGMVSARRPAVLTDVLGIVDLVRVPVAAAVAKTG